MKIPWKSVWTVVRAIYVAFLKGKVVNIPGVGPVTLPQQDHTIRPLAALEWPSEQERRAPRPPRRPDGLPDPAPPPCPLSVSTLGILLFVFFGLPIIALTMLGVLEWRTLADDTPGNHVSATMRAAWKRAPGAVFLASLVWVAFLVAVGMGLAAHFFWS